MRQGARFPLPSFREALIRHRGGKVFVGVPPIPAVRASKFRLCRFARAAGLPPTTSRRMLRRLSHVHWVRAFVQPSMSLRSSNSRHPQPHLTRPGEEMLRASASFKLNIVTKLRSRSSANWSVAPSQASKTLWSTIPKLRDVLDDPIAFRMSRERVSPVSGS